MFAWPPIMMLEVRLVIKSRTGRSRAVNLLWSHSHRLFSDCPVLWNAAEINSSIMFASAGARSVMTSAGSPCAVSDAVKNHPAEAISR